MPEMPAIEDDSVSVTLDLGDPPEEVMEYARTVVNENPDTRSEIIQELRDMIYERGEVMPHRTDDEFLLRFLRARNFQVKRSHRLFVNYYKFKENNPDIHKGINPLKLKFIGDDGVVSVPPYRDQTGRRIMIHRVGNWNPSKYSVDELFKVTVVVLELGILEQRAQILGGVCLFDLQGLSLQHVWHVTPSVAHRMLDLMVKSFPMKVHAIHVLNQSWVFDIIWTLFKPLLDDMMRSRIFFHGSNMESLHKHVSPKYLPVRYGGIRREYNYNDWIDNISQNQAIIDELRSLGYVHEPEES